jgi:hypothetical protein
MSGAERQALIRRLEAYFLGLPTDEQITAFRHRLPTLTNAMLQQLAIGNHVPLVHTLTKARPAPPIRRTWDGRIAPEDRLRWLEQQGVC